MMVLGVSVLPPTWKSHSVAPPSLLPDDVLADIFVNFADFDLSEALRVGNKKTFYHIIQKYECSKGDPTILIAIEMGNLPLLKFIAGKCTGSWTPDVFSAGAKSSDL